MALDDPLVRQKIGPDGRPRSRCCATPACASSRKLEKGQRPGPESSVDKLYYSEMDKRHQELIQEILGPYGQLSRGLPDELALDADSRAGREDTWAYNFLWSRAGTIYAGSSEIQKNIIGERVLRLPREVRADRMAGEGRPESDGLRLHPRADGCCASLAREFLTPRVLAAGGPQADGRSAGYNEALWKQLAETGLLGIAIDEEHGGQGLGMIELALVLEEMGRAAYPGPYFATVVLAATAHRGRRRPRPDGRLPAGHRRAAS